MTPSELDEREPFEAEVRSLEGRRVLQVDYWDIHNFGVEPARWDYGDWHHAVMGVQLMTDDGPRTVTWTNRFFPYGVDVFADPIERHLVLGDTAGPERIGPIGLSRWAEFVDTPIVRATIWWNELELGPSVRVSTGEVVEPARTVLVPVSLHLDFSSGSVWFVAAPPEGPSPENAFVGGDEIMVVFAGETMRALGFTDPAFL